MTDDQMGLPFDEQPESREPRRPPKRDLGPARDARDEAVERVDDNNADWIERMALPAIRAVAREHTYFITDQVWERVSERPREPRAMGAAMTRAKSEGWIRPTDEWRQSASVTNHARPCRVWVGVEPPRSA